MLDKIKIELFTVIPLNKIKPIKSPNSIPELKINLRKTGRKIDGKIILAAIRLFRIFSVRVAVRIKIKIIERNKVAYSIKNCLHDSFNSSGNK